MELHYVVKKKKVQQTKNFESDFQKEDLKSIIENWKKRKKIELFIDSVQKKNEFLQK